MRLRSKTKRRLALLAGVGCALAIVAISLLFVRNWQRERLTDRFRTRALAAYQQKDYAAAILNAGSYLKRPTGDQRDPDILLAYAESRANLQEQNGSHLTDAIAFYERYLQVRPEDRERTIELLRLYNRRGFFVEAADRARKARPADLKQITPAELPILEQEAVALINSRAFDDPGLKPVLDRIDELEPLNAYSTLLRIDSINRGDVQGRRVQESRAWADTLLASNPEHPTALLAAAISRLVSFAETDRQQTRQWLAKAAGLDAPSGARVQPATYTNPYIADRLVHAFDFLGAIDHSIEVLRDASDRLKDVDHQPRLVRRLWQDGLHTEVDERTKALDPAAPTSNPIILGFRALSLQALGREEESKAIAAALGKRKGDFWLSSWATALRLAKPDDNLIKRVGDLKELIRANKLEPVFHAWLGETLIALGRGDEARTAWSEASKAPEGGTWPLPRVRSAETLLLDGRLDEALAAIDEARRIGSNRAVVNVVFLEIQAARLQTGASAWEPAELAVSAEQIYTELDKLPDSDSLRALKERLIVPRVIFLSRAGQPEKARQLALEVLESDRPLQAQTVQRLALAGTVERLNIDEACAARETRGSTESATIVYTRALELGINGRIPEGKALLEADVKARPSDPERRLALARYLERVRDPGALAVWKELGEKFEQNLGVQKACLGSSAIAADEEFVEKTIARYRTLAGIEAGSDDVTINLARARSLLHGTPTLRDRDRAVAILGEISREQPRMVEPRLMLAMAHAIADPVRGIRPDLSRAIGALGEAFALDPKDVRIALELARLLQLQGQFDRAREHLNRIAQNEANDTDHRRQAAEMLIAQGDASPVADKVLQRISEKMGDRTPAGVLVALAEIYGGQRRTQEANALYERLASTASDPDSIFMTVRHFTLLKQDDRAQAMLARLESINPPPGARDLIQGRLAVESGDLEAASRHFEAAAQANPASADVWRHYAGANLRRARFAEATEICERGLKAIPGDLSLAVLLEQARLLRAGAEDADLAPLIRSLASSPAFTNSAEIIAAVKQAREKGELESAEGLMRLADHYTTSAPVQMYVARRMMLHSPQRASVIVNRAIAADRADPGPPRLAAEIYLQLERWTDLHAAAIAWRDRDASRSPEPDVAIAQAQLGLRQFDQGIATLKPRIAQAIANPGEPFSPGILNIYAKLLIGSGREQQARAELMPVFRASQFMRIFVGLTLAAKDVPTLPAARAWLDEIGAIEPDSAEDQLAVANGYAMLASRFAQSSTELLEQARARLVALTEKPPSPSAQVFELLGIIHQRLNQDKEAEQAYRRAIELDANRAGALNNLANIAMQRDLDEALTLARRAVEASPIPDPGHLDTLAAVYYQRGMKAADPEVARAEFGLCAETYRRLSRLQPGNINALHQGSAAAVRAGDYPTAIGFYEDLLRAQLPPEQIAFYRNNLAGCLLQQNAGKADLDRARELAGAAVRSKELPNYLDTLGWANLLSGMPQDAERTFRRALELAKPDDPARTSVAIGLASVLATREEPARAEAQTLIGDLDPATLDADLRAKLDRVNAQLGASPR
jgi:tetratricopeptide (TPR) repeat protein